MSQKIAVRHRVTCQITAKTTVPVASNMSAQNRKEDANQTLYLNRV